MEENKTSERILGCIDAAEAKKMIQNYQKEAGHLSSYTRSVWFGLDELEQLIRDIRTEQYEAGERPNRYGIRFYFGKYGKDVKHTTINEEEKDYSERNTILMVSTRQKESYGTKPLVNENYFGNCFIPIENKGELCPDQCEGDII